jgi:glycosyltransferase involved in cell wall biosynthesis
MLPVEDVFGIRKPSIGIPTFELRPDQISRAPDGRLDLIFLPVIPWAYRWQRPQQLAAALARRGHRVFYGALNGPGEPSREAAVESGVILLPIEGIRWEDPPDLRLQGRALRLAERGFERYRERFGLRSTALIIETPYWEPLAVRLRRRFGWKVVYDCLDEYAGFASNRPSVLREAEERLAPEADLVVATSTALLEKLTPRSRVCRLLPNACDYELFHLVGDPKPEGERLRIGYIGAVEAWFDAALFGELARRRPDWSFEIVGEAQPEVARALAGLTNVRLHGERPHGELPGFLSRFDVLVIPFCLTELTHAVDPVKLYEAAAAGRGVVATPMAQVGAYAQKGVVRLASTPEEFEREIRAAAAEDPTAVLRRRAFGRDNTWERRAGELEEALDWVFAVESTRLAEREARSAADHGRRREPLDRPA